jgi:hypothetical protein
MTDHPIWLFWEGPRPAYIDLCLQTIVRRYPDARLLDRAGFDALWVHDRDLPLDSLALNHQSDFIRAYLLAHHGGLYVDADCVALRDLSPLTEMARQHGFVGYREPQGYMSCNLMGARAGGAVIADHYRRVVTRLRQRTPLQWLDLASTPMNAAIAARGREALILPTQAVMPLPWNESEALAVRRDDSRHAALMVEDAWCYMLSNNTIRSDERTRLLSHMPAEHLLAERYFLSYLLRRGLDLPPLADAFVPEPTPEHLGGHEHKTQFDEGALDYLIARFGASSFLDVGCGPPGMVYYARSRGLHAMGVDGDPLYARDSPVIIEHDYARGPLDAGRYDLGWAVEFVEHVDEDYVPHFMATFGGCEHVFITAAVPGQPGHHHVNCQWGDYWIARFAEAGFVHDPDATAGVRAHSSMRSRFSEQTGLVFNRAG